MTQVSVSFSFKAARAWCLTLLAGISGIAPATAATPPAPVAAAHGAAVVPAVPTGPAWICDRLNLEESYSDRGLRFLRLGKNNWVFRDHIEFVVLAPVPQPEVEQFADLQKSLAAKHVRLVVMIPPPRGAMMKAFIDTSVPSAASFSPGAAMQTYNISLQRLRGIGIAVPDVAGFAARPETRLAGVDEQFYLSADLHWTATGAHASALAVAKTLETLPEFKTVPHAAFKTVSGKAKPVKEGYRAEAARICKATFAPETEVEYQTQQANSGGGGLLGDEQVAITLVGTSFSTIPHPNFSGFLRDALQADVTNYAIGGGGFDAAILSYLTSDDFAQNKPAILLWEMQFHNLRETANFPLILGAAQGDCGSNALLKTSPVTLRIGQTSVFNLTDGQRSQIKGKANVVVDINSADPRHYHLNLSYTDGQTSRFDIDAGRWQHAASKMIINLPRDGKDLAGVSLVPDQKLPGTVSAHICRAV